ncbi:hypothetical protein DOT_5020 [Desulfosporosinus sp. OT]|nr:hypothetical protein DOT_5020 [Desulfosporosinus sp. OT]
MITQLRPNSRGPQAQKKFLSLMSTLAELRQANSNAACRIR